MSTTAKNLMLQKLTSYFTKVESNIKPLVYEVDVPLASFVVKQYDLKTLMPDHANYELRSARVNVLVLNTEPASPLINSYVNSEAVVSVGIDANGVVKIINTDVSDGTFIIRIDKPSVKK